MSVENVNEERNVCPCGRTVQIVKDTTGENLVAPHHPGRTAGMPNLHNRKARKAAWCDVAAREEQALMYVRSGKQLLVDHQDIEQMCNNRPASAWMKIDAHLAMMREGNANWKGGNK